MAESENTLRFRSLSTKRRKPSSIDGLPEEVLVEILCRLKCSKLVFQCKSVSKRWHNLIENQHFIGRFVQHMQSCYKKTANIRSLMDQEAEEFPPKTPSSNKLLTPVFESIKSIHGLRVEPVVVATYNDLVLCCSSEYFQGYYYICNALTMEWVALPPAPSRHRYVCIGFICDIPNYNCENDNCKMEDHKNIRGLNASEYRYKVVRIFPRYDISFKLNVEIFSSETGEWTESVVPSPRQFCFSNLHPYSFVYHGRIYWGAAGEIFFVGLGPFYDHNDSTSNGIDHKLHCTISEEPLPYGFIVQYLGVCRGLVQMCGFYKCFDKILHVFELKEQDGAASGQLCLSKHNVYPLDPKMFQDSNAFGLLAFDPDNKDFMYLKVEGVVFKSNIHTREWLKMAEKWTGFCNYLYPVVFPWWPTPVPRLYGTMPHDRSIS